jgi:hypothetical protein
MIKKLLFIFTILSSIIRAQSQVYEEYPAGQYFYKGGSLEFHKDIKRIIETQKLLPCENTEEKYTIPVIVRADETITFIKYSDSVEITKNKCAYDFGRKLIPFLKNWQSATIDNKNVSAIVEIVIDPFFLFHSKEDPKYNQLKQPKYKKGMQSFNYELTKIFESYINENENKFTNITFLVNEKGFMENFIIEGEYSDSEKRSIIRDLSKIKGQWEPGTFNGIPRKFKLRQPIRQNFDLNYENKRFEKMEREFRNR